MASRTMKFNKKPLAKFIWGNETVTRQKKEDVPHLLVVLPNAHIKYKGRGDGKIKANYIVVLKKAFLDKVDTYSKKFTYLRKAKTNDNSSIGGIRAYKSDFKDNKVYGGRNAKAIKSRGSSNISQGGLAKAVDSSIYTLNQGRIATMVDCLFGKNKASEDAILLKSIGDENIGGQKAIAAQNTEVQKQVANDTFTFDSSVGENRAQNGMSYTDDKAQIKHELTPKRRQKMMNFDAAEQIILRPRSKFLKRNLKNTKA